MIGATAWMSCGSDETVSFTHTRTLSVPHTPSTSQLLSSLPTRFRAVCQSSAALVRVPARGRVDGARGSLVDVERRLVFRVFGTCRSHFNVVCSPPTLTFAIVWAVVDWCARRRAASSQSWIHSDLCTALKPTKIKSWIRKSFIFFFVRVSRFVWMRARCSSRGECLYNCLNGILRHFQTIQPRQCRCVDIYATNKQIKHWQIKTNWF